MTNCKNCGCEIEEHHGYSNFIGRVAFVWLHKEGEGELPAHCKKHGCINPKPEEGSELGHDF